VADFETLKTLVGCTYEGQDDIGWRIRRENRPIGVIENLGEGLSFATYFASIGHRVAKLGVFKPPKQWVSGPNPTHVKHLNGTCHHPHVLPTLRTTCWDKKRPHVVLPISGEFTSHSVKKSGAPESGYANKSGMGRKP
jgi:hypothetical protein